MILFTGFNFFLAYKMNQIRSNCKFQMSRLLNKNKNQLLTKNPKKIFNLKILNNKTKFLKTKIQQKNHRILKIVLKRERAIRR